MFPGDDGYPGDGDDVRQDGAVRAARRRWSGRRTATSAPACARRGACSTTRRICSSTPASRTTRRGARRSRSPNPPGGFADPYLGYPGGNPFPALNTGWATQPFPAFGVYVNTPLAHRADVAAAVERQRAAADRRLAGWRGSYLGNHSSHLWRATELNPAVFGPGATTGEHQPARRVLDAAEPAAGTVLRHDRPARRHRPRQLRRAAALAAAPAEEQPERAVELDALEVHERSGDDRDHRPDDRRPGQPGSGLLVLLVGSPPRRQPLASSCARPTSRTRRCARCSATGSCRRSSGGSRGNRSSDHDRRRQRADRPGRPAGGADPRRSVRHRRARQCT